MPHRKPFIHDSATCANGWITQHLDGPTAAHRRRALAMALLDLMDRCNPRAWAKMEARCRAILADECDRDRGYAVPTVKPDVASLDRTRRHVLPPCA